LLKEGILLPARDVTNVRITSKLPTKAHLFAFKDDLPGSLVGQHPRERGLVRVAVQRSQLLCEIDSYARRARANGIDPVTEWRGTIVDLPPTAVESMDIYDFDTGQCSVGLLSSVRHPLTSGRDLRDAPARRRGSRP
jgi:hypothetical protein